MNGGGQGAPRGGPGTLMDYIRASELGYCRAICSGALLYDPFQTDTTD